MRLFICVNFIVLCIYVRLTHGFPQSFDDPTKFFKPIDFEAHHRGSFNITDCVKELINCWEIIKVDYVCSENYIYDSVCGIYYIECDENTGFKENPYLKIYEGFCRYD